MSRGYGSHCSVIQNLIQRNLKIHPECNATKDCIVELVSGCLCGCLCSADHNGESLITSKLCSPHELTDKLYQQEVLNFFKGLLKLTL